MMRRTIVTMILLPCAAHIAVAQEPTALTNVQAQEAASQRVEQFEPDQLTSSAQTTHSPDGTTPTKTTDETTKRTLIQRGIYQCHNGARMVFVDEDHIAGLSQCTQIRAPHYERQHLDEQGELGNEDGMQENAPCSGAVIYKGSTYIFSDHQPCPIPAAIFDALTPIESHPNYYTQPLTQNNL